MQKLFLYNNKKTRTQKNPVTTGATANSDDNESFLEQKNAIKNYNKKGKIKKVAVTTYRVSYVHIYLKNIYSPIFTEINTQSPKIITCRMTQWKRIKIFLK